MLERKFYLDRIVRNMWNGEIKVITGIRRCGKSVLLFELFAAWLRQNGTADEQIIKIALDHRKHYKFRNPVTLCDYVENIVTAMPEKKYYLLLDEIQFTQKFKDENGIEVTIYDMLNELKNYANLDVYVTGSNSKMLSGDIATEFRGRAVQIYIQPFSFEEFYAWRGGDTAQALEDYMLFGGMPRLTQIEDERDKKNYLTTLYKELYIKDLAERNKIEHENILNEILDFLASQIGSLTNPAKIANAISSMKKEPVNVKLVGAYIEHTKASFLISEAKRYDIKGKAYFCYPNKYYYTDTGLRNARLNFRQYDKGHLMENIIYNDLIRRGCSVDVGVVQDRRGNANTKKEIDFVVNSGDKRIYIQSALGITGSEKEAAETDSLKLTGDFFKKILIRADISHNYYDDCGILHCSLADFLLGKIELI